MNRYVHVTSIKPRNWEKLSTSERDIINQLKNDIVCISSNKDARIKVMTEENVGRGEVMLMTRVSVIQRCNLCINAEMKRTYNTVLPKLLGEVCH
jgi:hypothetical protein